MKQKTTYVKSLLVIMALFCAVNFGFGQIITFDFAGNVGDETSVVSNSNDAFLSLSTITRGVGLTPRIKSGRFNSSSWALTNIANAVIGNKYVQFTISPVSGYQFDITTIVLNIQRTDFGLRGIVLRSSTDGYTNNIDGEKAIADIDNTTEIITFTVNQPYVATAITYRVYGWAEAGTGHGGLEGLGNDIIVNGSVSAIPPCGGLTTTFNLGIWDNGAPDLSTPAVIATDYDTATYGSFFACSLTVNPGATLSINDEDNGPIGNTFVVVQNDVTVDGTILINPKAAFVQLDDSGAVNGTGTTQVEKLTAPMNNWYEYTYWSSPVFEPQIGTALTDSNPSRRFLFNAQNFLDIEAEIGNNNSTAYGHDDVDDNGDDWKWVNGLTTMKRGVGYATTHSEAAFFGPPMSTPPYQFKYTFEGSFNNGVIPVSVYRNDSDLFDNNWNLIGNPYPSAIDVDLFLAANTNIESGGIVATNTIDGAIFLWSQNTDYSATANGSQALNFSDADYAIINGTGEVAGGDGLKPERRIPSGQAFFVSMSNTAPSAVLVSGNIYTADVIFSNSMRVRGVLDNSQFFKDSNSKEVSLPNKLWINLTSDNGVFNQTFVGYVNGATNQDDGAYFDAKKNVSTSTSAILYTTIEGSSKKFAIQGKDANSLNTEETIQLGFKTNIKVATQYKLSIPKIEGEFITNNTIYLKDNVLNTMHNLSESDYTFTSEVGEFNERFVVMFNNESLSTNDLISDANTIKIVDLGNDRVTFKTTNNLKIKNVAIYDMLGRQLYQFKGKNSEETYTLLALKHAIYIAKVELLNGAIITKKAIKK